MATLRFAARAPRALGSLSTSFTTAARPQAASWLPRIPAVVQQSQLRKYTDFTEGPYRTADNPDGAARALHDEKFHVPGYSEMDMPTAEEIQEQSIRRPEVEPPEHPKLVAIPGEKPPTLLGTSLRLPEFNLAGKVVLVSGGARGLGLTQAEALLEAGAKVYCIDRLEEPDAEFNRIQRRAAEKLGTSLHYRQIDIRDVVHLNTVVGEIADENQRLDGLVAAAGIQQETPALEYTAEDANMMMQVNIVGAMMTAQAAARAFLKYECKGSIVMIASMSGTIANRGLICSAYNASKAGVLQLARNLASEWGPYGIRVNTISPGYIVTAMVEKLFEQYPERKTEWPTQNMLQRLSTPDEYRGAAVFLISPASNFMTGADLRIDGGHSAW